MAYARSQAMQKEFRLPMVPGSTCGEEMMRRSYHRSQIHGRQADCATTYPAVPPDRTATNQQLASTIASYMNGTANTALDTTRGSAAEDGATADLSGRVLRFYGYTVEPVPESAQETERVRKVTLQYFLEDNTMSVTEPAQDNSGIAFRASLKRHLIPSPDGQLITFQQLKVGEPVTFYGRTYLLYDADPFTRDFYRALGNEQPGALNLPLDRYTASRSRPVAKAHDVTSIAACSALNTLLTPEQVRATQQFLAHDREVLRCDCTWDDSASLHGYKHYLTLYYFLADGSLALVEKETQNSGRDPFPTFFRRQRIAKPSDPDGRFDSSSLGAVTFQEEGKGTVYYSDKDIRIGNVLYLFGRPVRIHGYNAFTRDYLSAHFGVTDHTPLPGAVPPPFVPPGSVRQGLSDNELQDKHRQKNEDIRRRRFESSVVKFLMKLDNDTYEDAIRRFVLAVYPADDTVAIYEPVIRNSGIVGGKFLQRQKVRRPDGALFTADDFYVGAHVVLNSFAFVLLASDEHSLNYMEHNAEEFSRSDINKVVRKLQAMLRSRQTGLAEALRKADETNTQGLEMARFLAVMSELKLDVSEQEILTVLRFFDKNNESYVSYEEVASRILPEGAALAGDERAWQDIYDESVRQETASFVTDPAEAREKQRLLNETEAAARGAREFVELYDQRRQLFVKEFRAIVDYARDALVGVDEFKLCVRQKLRVESITDEELNALCGKLFTEHYPRVTFEELMRLFNNTSSLPHNLAQIVDKTSK